MQFMQQRPWLRHYDTWVPTRLRYPRTPVQDILLVATGVAPDKAAINYFGTTLSFRQVRLTSLSMAASLAALGVSKGDRVALHLPNCPQYVIAYFAVLHLGAVVVNLNPMYTPDELEHAARLTKPMLWFTSQLTMSPVATVLQRVEGFRAVVTHTGDYAPGTQVSSAANLNLPEDWLLFSDLLETRSKPPRVGIDPEDPAVIIFTGGTTGTPKGAVLSHANIVSSTTACCAWGEGLTRLTPVAERSVMSVLPFFHVYGHLCCLQYSMYNIATMHLIPRFDLDEFMETLAGIDRITFFPAVPTLIRAVINHPRAGELELDRKIALFNNGGGPMPLEVIEQVKDLGISYSEGWGMSETASMGIANPVIGMRKAGSIGIPLIGADVKLVDISDGKEEVSQGEPGEILIRAPYVMQGYWDNPEETANQFTDGWLCTGDIAVQDEDGYIFIVDRKKDMIIAGGYNIYPREIDEVLFAHPKVAEGISLGVPDQYRGETVKAFVVLKPGESASEKEIIDFCREHLASYKIPKSVEFRDELPKSAVGKLLRKVLRDQEIAKSRSRN
jgi:long-chain acyl-CoA synthetase